MDDPVGALGVHGAAGIWGVLAVGLFADSELPGIEALVQNCLFCGCFWCFGSKLLVLCGHFYCKIDVVKHVGHVVSPCQESLEWEVGAGLFRGGGMELLGIQLLSVLAIIGWSVLTVHHGSGFSMSR